MYQELRRMPPTIVFVAGRGRSSIITRTIRLYIRRNVLASHAGGRSHEPSRCAVDNSSRRELRPLKIDCHLTIPALSSDERNRHETLLHSRRLLNGTAHRVARGRLQVRIRTS